MKRHLKRALELLIVPLAAAIVFFEQTLIKYLNARHGGGGALAADRAARGVAGGLPPYAALCAFVAPSIADPADQARRRCGSSPWGSTGLRFATLVVGKMLGTGVRGAALPHPAADAGDDCAGSPGPIPGSSTGATGLRLREVAAGLAEGDAAHGPEAACASGCAGLVFRPASRARLAAMMKPFP